MNKKMGRPRKYEANWNAIRNMRKNGFNDSKIAYWLGIPRTSVIEQHKLMELSTALPIDEMSGKNKIESKVFFKTTDQSFTSRNKLKENSESGQVLIKAE